MKPHRHTYNRNPHPYTRDAPKATAAVAPTLSSNAKVHLNQQFLDPISKQRALEVYSDLHYLIFVTVDICNHLTHYDLPALTTVKQFPGPLRSHLYYLYTLAEMSVDILSTTKTLAFPFNNSKDPYFSSYVLTAERPSFDFISRNFKHEWFHITDKLRDLYIDFEHCHRVPALFHTLRCPVHSNKLVHNLTHSISPEMISRLDSRIGEPDSFQQFKNLVCKFADLKLLNPSSPDATLPLFNSAFFKIGKAPGTVNIANFCKFFIMNSFEPKRGEHNFADCVSCDYGDCSFMCQGTFYSCDFGNSNAKDWYEESAQFCSCKEKIYETKYYQAMAKVRQANEKVDNLDRKLYHANKKVTQLDKEIVSAKEEIFRLQCKEKRFIEQDKADKIELFNQQQIIIGLRQELSYALPQAPSDQQQQLMGPPQVNPTADIQTPRYPEQPYSYCYNPSSVATLCEDEPASDQTPLPQLIDELPQHQQYISTSNSRIQHTSTATTENKQDQRNDNSNTNHVVINNSTFNNSLNR